MDDSSQIDFSKLAAVAAQRDWFTTLRSIDQFAGLSHFSSPRSISEAGLRLEANLSYFLSNYLGLSLATLFYGIIFKPWLFFLFVIISAVGYQLIFKMDTVKVGEYSLSGRPKVITFAAVSAFLILLFAGSALLAIILINTLVVLIHGIAHGTIRDSSSNAGPVEMQMSLRRNYQDDSSDLSDLEAPKTSTTK